MPTLGVMFTTAESDRPRVLALTHFMLPWATPLGDETAFVPGHGPMSTFGHERRSNPFVADQVLAR